MNGLSSLPLPVLTLPDETPEDLLDDLTDEGIPAPPPPPSLAERLAKGQHRRIARRSGVDHGCVSRVLSGRAPRPSVDVLARIAHAVGATLDEVYGYIREAQQKRRDSFS